MQIIKIDLAFGGAMLAPLRTLSSEPNSWGNMPNKALGADSKNALQKLYAALYDADEANFAEQIFIRMQFGDNGTVKRIYPPALYAPPEGIDLPDGTLFTIRWGDAFIPLGFDGQSFIPLSEKRNVMPVTFTFVDVKIGSYSEPCLQATLLDKANQKVYSLPFQYKAKDWQNKPTCDVLNTDLMLGNIDGLIEKIQQAKIGSGSGSSSTTVEDCKMLVEGQLYKFTSAKKVTRKKGGHTYILKTSDGFQCWAPSAAVELLEAGAYCTSSQPFCITRTTKGDKNQYDYSAEWPPSDNALDLSWLPA